MYHQFFDRFSRLRQKRFNLRNQQGMAASKPPFNVRALFDFNGRGDNEHSLEAGKTYKVIKVNGEWWGVATGPNKTGWFPASYTEIVEDTSPAPATPEPVKRALPTPTQTGASPSAGRALPTPGGVKPLPNPGGPAVRDLPNPSEAKAPLSPTGGPPKTPTAIPPHMAAGGIP